MSENIDKRSKVSVAEKIVEFREENIKRIRADNLKKYEEGNRKLNFGFETFQIEHDQIREFIKLDKANYNIPKITNFIAKEVNQKMKDFRNVFPFQVFNMKDITDNIIFEVISAEIIKESQKNEEYKLLKEFARLVFLKEDLYKDSKSDNRFEAFYRNYTTIIPRDSLFPDLSLFKRKGNKRIVYKPFYEIVEFIMKCIGTDKKYNNIIKRKYKKININDFREFRDSIYQVLNMITENKEISIRIVENNWSFNYFCEILPHLYNYPLNKISYEIIFLEFIFDLPDMGKRKNLLDEYFKITKGKNTNVVEKRKQVYQFRENVIIYYHVLPEIIKNSIQDFIDETNYSFNDYDLRFISDFSTDINFDLDTNNADLDRLKVVLTTSSILTSDDIAYDYMGQVERYLYPEENTTDNLIDDKIRGSFYGKSSEVSAEIIRKEYLKLFTFIEESNHEDMTYDFDEINSLGIMRMSILSLSLKAIEYYERRYQNNITHYIDLKRLRQY